jgi:hypothetical protein
MQVKKRRRAARLRVGQKPKGGTLKTMYHRTKGRGRVKSSYLDPGTRPQWTEE